MTRLARMGFPYDTRHVMESTKTTAVPFLPNGWSVNPAGHDLQLFNLRLLQLLLRREGLLFAGYSSLNCDRQHRLAGNSRVNVVGLHEFRMSAERLPNVEVMPADFLNGFLYLGIDVGKLGGWGGL